MIKKIIFKNDDGNMPQYAAICLQRCLVCFDSPGIYIINCKFEVDIMLN